MNRYFFILGTAQDLCLAEVESLFKRLGFSYTLELVVPPVAAIMFPQPFTPAALMGQLGGTVKIARVLGSISALNPKQVSELFVQNLGEADTIGVSNYSALPLPIPKIMATLKSELQARGRSIRYVLPKEKPVLSSVVVKKQHVAEFIVAKIGNEIMVAKTEAVQDSDDWTKRDFGRPYADAHSGMLPPKIARMMVNVASSKFKAQSSKKQTILDPFCGMGTVLSEALMLGNNVIGSDLSKQSTEKAQKNIAWLQRQYPLTSALTARFFTADAVHIAEYLEKESVDGIVTEPFLGSPFEIVGGELRQNGKRVTREVIKNSIKGLEKLYIGALREWWPIIKPDGVIVIALPSIVFKREVYFVKTVIDKCETLGYTLTQGPYIYARPQAVVKRNIYVLKKSESRNPKSETNLK